MLLIFQNEGKNFWKIKNFGPGGDAQRFYQNFGIFLKMEGHV